MKSDATAASEDSTVLWIDDYEKKEKMEVLWLEQFGKEKGHIWTEYTLYRINLDFSGLFHHLHMSESRSMAH